MCDGRPLECSGCQKKAVYRYTFVSMQNTEQMELCESCPLLAKKHAQISKDSQLHIRCSSCGTSWETVCAEGLLGCASCYESFQEQLYLDLNQKGGRQLSYRKVTPSASPPLMELAALKEALHAALSQEAYEHAASLRDKIQQLQAKNDVEVK